MRSFARYIGRAIGQWLDAFSLTEPMPDDPWSSYAPEPGAPQLTEPEPLPPPAVPNFGQLDHTFVVTAAADEILTDPSRMQAFGAHVTEQTKSSP